MALTFTTKKRNVTGASRVWVGEITLDNSYPTNGEAIAPSDLGFNNSIDFLLAAPNGGLVFEFDHTNKKLKAFYPTGGATAAPTTIAAPSVTSGASTASAVNATTPALTPGLAKEVGNTADLSTIVVRVIAFGDNPYTT